MKKPNTLLIMLMLVVSWLTVPFLGAKTFKRFIPSSLLMNIYLILEGRLAEKKKWWWFPFKGKPNVLGELPLIVGPFLIGSIWILKFTYGKFNLYFIINLLVDTIFTFFVMDWFKKIGYVTLVRLTKPQLSLIFLIKTFVLYGSQFLYEKYVLHNQTNKYNT